MQTTAPLGALAATLIAASGAAADVRVATDIAPVQSLVAMVAGTTPEVLVRPGVSPHDAALRPSDARALETADVVVWVGPDLTPGLERAIGSLAGDAMVVTLMPDDADGAAEDAHDDEDHAEHEEGEHDHSAMAHGWLDPATAAEWLGAIADALAAADPGAETDYRARADAARTALFAITEDARAELADGGPVYIAAHDALAPFEARFGLTPMTPIATGDAAPPSAARMMDLQSATAGRPVDCVLDDGGLNPGLVEAIFPDGAPPIVAVDLLGAGLEPGPDLYPQLMRGLLDAMDACRKANE